MENITKETMTIELTYEQYKHIQSILNQDKPSRTRLTRDEKDMINLMCNRWDQSFSTTKEEDKLIKSIKLKINKKKFKLF
jgi:hypothetical protein